MENTNVMNTNPAPVAPATVNPAPVFYSNKDVVKAAVKNASGIKFTAKTKADMWKARNLFKDFVLSLHAGGVLNPVLFEQAASLFHDIILSVHGLDIPGGVIVSDLLAALVSASVNKKTFKKDTKIAGPGAFTSFVKGYAINQYGNDFAFTEQKNPNEKKPAAPRKKKTEEEKLADRKTATVSFLKSMTDEERAELLAMLAA